jgi:hypothetical protein
MMAARGSKRKLRSMGFSGGVVKMAMLAIEYFGRVTCVTAANSADEHEEREGPRDRDDQHDWR